MELAERTAEVRWNGTLASGDGTLRAGSDAVTDLPIDWASSSATAHGTSSPEELLAGAHASCYAMALSLLLTRDGTPPQSLDVRASCSLEEDGDWYTIKAMELDVRGSVPNLGADAFERAAKAADEHCPISNAVRDNVEVRVTASLR